jgi:hypothetical protein
MTLRFRLALLYGLLSSLALGIALLLAYGFYERAAYRNAGGVLNLFANLARERMNEPGMREPLETVPMNVPVSLRLIDSSGRLNARVILRVNAPVFPVLRGEEVPAHAPWVNLLPTVSATPQEFIVKLPSLPGSLESSLN